MLGQVQGSKEAVMCGACQRSAARGGSVRYT